MLKIIATIIGIVAIAESLLIYASVKRERILLFKLISDVLWGANYLLLGMYTGALLNVIAIGREIIFYHRSRHKWANNIAWFFVFVALTLISPILSWAGWISILPALGSVFAVMSFYCKKELVMKIFAFPAQGLWFTYNLLSENWSGLASCSITLVSIVIGLVREFCVARKAKRMIESESPLTNDNI